MAEHVRHQLARASIVVRPSRVITLAQFVQSRTEEDPASPAHLDLLIGEALDELRPDRFRSVAQYAGFRASVVALIEAVPASMLPEDLARIAAHVEHALMQRGMALRSARLASAARNPAATFTHIVLDGFFFFSSAELALVESLEQSSQLTVTLPAWPGAEHSRARLLARGFVEKHCSESYRHPAITAFSAPTLERESEEIARQILEHAARGRPFREMGVVLRSRDPYAPALETTFARFGIPARFYFADPLSAHPAIDYLSRLVRALLEGWDHASLLAALRMPISGIGATPAGDAFDFALRQKLPGAGLPLPGTETFPHVVNLLTSLDSWKQHRLDPENWAACLKTLRMLLPRPLIEDRVERAQWNCWRSTAAAIEAFETLVDDAAAAFAGRSPVQLVEFWKQVETSMSLELLRVPDRRRNVVHVMDAYEARQWELPVVFVCGLVERHFPQYHREDPLFGDAARKRAGLQTSAELQREERFLFDIATTRATELTVLSLARFNEKGEDSLVSGFAARIDFEPVPTRVRPRPSRTVPTPTTVAIRQDASLAQLAQAHKRLAATSIESFLQCPFQFFANRTLRLNPRPAAPRDRLDARLQGSILHRALAELIRTPLFGGLVLDEAFADECRRANIPMTYRAEAVRLELARHFEAFAADRQVTLDWDKRVEEKFSFAMNPLLTITGRIDRLDIGPRGQALVIDYKYSARNKIREFVSENADGNLVQGGLYMAAAKRALHLEPAGMLYCGLRKDVVWGGWHAPIEGLERVGESRTPAALNELIDAAIAKASNVFESIASGEIVARPADKDKCLWCDFRDICRVETARLVKIAGGSPS
jgi:hypothetical protein